MQRRIRLFLSELRSRTAATGVLCSIRSTSDFRAAWSLSSSLSMDSRVRADMSLEISSLLAAESDHVVKCAIIGYDEVPSRVNSS